MSLVFSGVPHPRRWRHPSRCGGTFRARNALKGGIHLVGGTQGLLSYAPVVSVASFSSISNCLSQSAGGRPSSLYISHVTPLAEGQMSA